MMSCSGPLGAPEMVSGKVMYYVQDSGASATAEMYVGDEYVGLIQHNGMKKFNAEDGTEIIVIYNISTMRVIKKKKASEGFIWHIE